MAWEADVKIAGPVGSMGQRVLQPIINQQVGNVLTALEKKVAGARAVFPTVSTREFGGGEKLGLQDLADHLGVSRSPVATRSPDS